MIIHRIDNPSATRTALLLQAIAFALCLFAQSVSAQNDLSAMRDALCSAADRPRTGSANDRRAREFEWQLATWIKTLEDSANRLGIVLEVPDVQLTPQEQIAQARYRHGSMNASEMKSYEASVSSIVASLQHQVTAKENAVNRTWAQQNPDVVARLLDIEREANTRLIEMQNAELQAVIASEEAEDRARQAEARARRAEEKARDAERQAEMDAWHYQQFGPR